MLNTCVVHLLRFRNGPGPFGKFMESLRENPGGHPFDLLLIFKGFPSRKIPEDYSELIRSLSHRRLFVPDIGFDIAPYFKAAREFEYDYFCFLNSFSALMDPEWLRKLSRPVLVGGVGVAGATGSWISHYTNLLNDPSQGREVSFGRRKITLPGFLHRPVRRYFLNDYLRTFGPFPNPHIRTNAFLVPREVMRRLHPGLTFTKPGVYRCESGSRGLTRQIQAMGLRTVVVGRDGKWYDPPEWPASNTFWQGDQGNLLVEDNQTARYAAADLETRCFLARIAWGEKARAAGETSSGGPPS